MKNPSYVISGEATDTIRIPVTDAPQSFTVDQRHDGTRPAIAVVITCETEQVRVCYGGAIPTAGAAGLGHILYVGQSLRLANSHSISTFSFINHTQQDQGFLQVTFEFEPAPGR